jgi:small-conductance mechanosensitive channel
MSDVQNLADRAKELAENLEAQAAEETVPKEPANIIEIDENLQEQAADLIGKSDVVLDPYIWGQVGVILIIIGLAHRIGVWIRTALEREIEKLDFKTSRKLGVNVIRRLPRLVLPAVSMFGFYLAERIAAFNQMPSDILGIATSLAFAVLMITFAVSFIKSRFISRTVTNLTIVMAALHAFGWWDLALSTLDSVKFGLGDSKVSLLTVVKGLFYFVIFLWSARLLSTLAEKQIKSVDELTPSLKVLFSKVLKILIVFIAVLLGLNAIGVDLTSFAIFGGAIGVGLGFGLQKVVSNFISGIILLLDRSIKPGDVIAVDGPDGQMYGWVNTLGARYVSIIRRDGKEHLIPNEIMITERVENWSFSNDDIRISIPVGVSYNCDIHRARELCMQAVSEEPRIKEFPKPLCHVTGFGDNSVNFEIRGWINDPVNGIANVTSDILVRVWDKFQEHGIEIPFPQRDLHVRSIDTGVVKQLKKELSKG